MEKEKSCGAVIYKYENNKLYILLIKHNIGHWSFPKGHMEKDETEEETALREIKEETNLDVLINNNFRYITTYKSKPNTIKDVVYFIATPKTTTLKPQLEEVSIIKWYEENEALKIITYEKDKIVLENALKYLHK